MSAFRDYRKALLGLCIVCACMVGTSSASGGPLPRFCQVRTAQSALAISKAEQGLNSRSAPHGIRLLVSDEGVEAGETVYARLANFGKSLAGYGREFKIERHTRTGWMLDPSSPKGPWVRVRGLLRPGSAGKCYRFNVPTEEPRGQYRFATKVEVRINEPQPNTRTGNFRVQ